MLFFVVVFSAFILDSIIHGFLSSGLYWSFSYIRDSLCQKCQSAYIPLYEIMMK